MVAERRISSLRILRRRDERRHPSSHLLAEPDEGVRIIRPTSPPEPEPEPTVGAAGSLVESEAEVSTGAEYAAVVPEPDPAAAPELETGATAEPSTGAEIVSLVPPPEAPAPAAQPAGPEAEAWTAPVPEAPTATGGGQDSPTGEIGLEDEESRPSVDELFARLRAEREAARAEAEAVLSELPCPDDAEPSMAKGTDEAGPIEDLGGVAATAQGTSSDAIGVDETAVSDEDGAGDDLLERRNRLTAPVHDRLARKLKRALQDDQNDLLDRARSRTRQADSDTLPGEMEHAARFRLAAAEVLDEAFVAGTEYALAVVPGAGPAVRPNGSDQAAVLADELVSELRGRLSRALAEPGLDEVGTADAVGAVYRSWKGARIETLAMDHVIAGFGRGVLASAPSGARLTWVVDDDGPCPDCDDNGLAGPTPAGDAFPTGQVHPPAHAGCRCLLAPGLT